MRHQNLKSVADQLIRWVGCGAFCIAALSWASDATAQSASTQPATQFDLSGFTDPPNNGGSSGNVGGLTRAQRELPLPLQYAPSTSQGLTSKPQPVLYYYVAETTPNKVLITIMSNTKKPETITAPVIDGIKQAGMQRFDVASTGQSLKPGVSYRWTVSIESESDQPSHNAYVSHNICYVPPSAELNSQLAGKSPEQQAELYLKNHYWYDTVAAAVQVIMDHPGEPAPKEQFLNLLKAGKCSVNAVEVGSLK